MVNFLKGLFNRSKPAPEQEVFNRMDEFEELLEYIIPENSMILLKVEELETTLHVKFYINGPQYPLTAEGDLSKFKEDVSEEVFEVYNQLEQYGTIGLEILLLTLKAMPMNQYTKEQVRTNESIVNLLMFHGLTEQDIYEMKTSFDVFYLTDYNKINPLENNIYKIYEVYVEN